MRLAIPDSHIPCFSDYILKFQALLLHEIYTEHFASFPSVSSFWLTATQTHTGSSSFATSTLSIQPRHAVEVEFGWIARRRKRCEMTCWEDVAADVGFKSYTRFGAICWFSFAFSRVCSWYPIANQGCRRFSSPLVLSAPWISSTLVMFRFSLGPSSRPSHVHKFKPADIATGEKLEAISIAVRRRTGRNAMR